jgi:aryl-alcohol dehydrogenase-like predicted oxidoreductase
MQLFQPRRELGRTGFKATQLGIGDLADRQIPLAACVKTLQRALDTGLNLVDTAPGYEDGYSEDIVGTALKGRRDGIFVIDKIDHLHDPVLPQIESSLRRLEMDHTDAFVFHAVSKMSDWEHLAQYTFPEVRKAIIQGKTRFTGISSHHPEVLEAAIKSGLCDILMFPVGPFVDERYVFDVLPKAKKAGLATVCFKTFGAGKLLGDTSGYNQPLQQRPRGKVSSGGGKAIATLPHMSVEDCLHYTLTLDPDVALLGLSFPNEQDAAYAAAQIFQPLSPESMDAIRLTAIKCVKDKGAVWWNPA